MKPAIIPYTHLKLKYYRQLDGPHGTNGVERLLQRDLNNKKGSDNIVVTCTLYPEKQSVKLWASGCNHMSLVMMAKQPGARL